jgi:hypothetical protein
MELYWRVYAPAGKRIRITVTYLATDPFDLLAIFEGTAFYLSSSEQISARR